MSKVYDSWEKLVRAVLNREELRRLALCDSFSSISTDFSSRFSFDSTPAASSGQSNFSYRVARHIEMKEIIDATKNFRHDMHIGEGILCQVFKAWIDEHTLTASNPESGMAVAVKICHERNRNWLKKINYLVQFHHPCLVDLVGYCMEEDSTILVYEFIEGGSLYDHLFTKGRRSLPWATRTKVALDAARGLSYLHDREIPVIHRDFWSANILLDQELNAKLSNYCYGKDDPIGDMTDVSTNQVLVLTGYTAPEYTSKGRLSTKSNVYTFGVVLLELLSGIQAPHRRNQEKQYFSKNKKLVQIMDARLDGQYSHDAAYEVAKLALKCLSLDPKSRPCMADVVAALQLLRAAA